jgi:hypothetical protein
MTTYTNVCWGLLLPSPIKRLNIVNGAQVKREFLDKMPFIGYAKYIDVINLLYDEDERKSLTWFWKSLKVMYPEYVYLFKTPIKQHLRFGKRGSLHFEEWIFGVFPCSDNMFRLCPLKRDSDFNSNIFDDLSLITKPAMSFPWQSDMYALLGLINQASISSSI